MRRYKPLLRAVAIGMCLGVLLGGLAVLAIEDQRSGFLEQKFLSLRYRVSEVLPHPTQPRFVPTPLALPGPANSPTTPATETLTTPNALGAAPTRTPSPTRAPTRTPTLSADLVPIQPTVALRGIKHAYQRWNNCGPATLEMDLSFFGLADSQGEIAAFTKPNPDDRNVRPDELAAYADRVGLRTIIGANGTLDRLKLLLSNGIPVIVETALVKQPQGWMGHYRLLIGYDAQQFNTMDSYDGADVKITFDALDAEWRAFNRLYLVVYPDSYDARVRAILSDARDPATMYAQAAARARAEIEANPQDAFAQFNLGSSLIGLKRYAEAAAAFDGARVLGLPWRMMWYQFGPYEAYLQAGRSDEVVALADSLLRATDDLEESHYYKGLALHALGRDAEARREIETALRYNKNYSQARRALTTLSN